MKEFLLSLAISFLIANSKKGLDLLTNEPQKFHEKPVPRIGGLSIFISTLYGFFVYKLLLNPLSLALSVSFLSGFIEDITRKISEKTRLLILILAAFIAIFFANVLILNLNEVPILGELVRFLPIAVVFTTIAIVGLANAFNIIDGLNGLASGTALIILASIYFVALQNGDIEIKTLSEILFTAILGFFVWNFPFGKIFLGDGGAYFIGFYIACLDILLNQKHQQVSDWYALAVIIYPVFEVIFSIIRRKFILGLNPLKPDNFHLHSLLFQLLMKKLSKSWANPLAALIILIAYAGYVYLVSIYWSDTPILLLLIAIFCAVYTIFYFALYKKVRD